MSREVAAQGAGESIQAGAVDVISACEFKQTFQSALLLPRQAKFCQNCSTPMNPPNSDPRRLASTP